MRKSDDSKPDATIDFAGLPSLVEAVRAFQAQAEQLDRATEKVAVVPRASSLSASPKLNDALAKVERAFLLEKGLPGRPWFKHAVYAPGLTTGYAAWPLPAIRQGLEDAKTPDRRWLPTSREPSSESTRRPRHSRPPAIVPSDVAQRHTETIVANRPGAR